MKKILAAILLFAFFTPNVFSADTSYIKTSTNQNKEDNYIANVAGSNGKVIKWKKNVLNVYIAPCSSERQKAILSAINLYNNSFWGILKFTQIAKPENADITIEFSKKIGYKDSISGETAGLTTYQYDKQTNYLTSAKIQILDANWTPSQIKQLTLHEMGHAIGISGHSLNSNDIMFPTTDGRGTFSKRDIETIKMIYKGKSNEVKNALKSSNEKKMEMSLEVYLRDIKYAPNNYKSWVNLGDFYYKNKDYNKAIEAYKTALTKNNVPTGTVNKRISYCYLELKNTRMADKYMKASQ